MREAYIGAHVTMKYRGRWLLGEVRHIIERKGVTWLTVHHFNGEPWPLEPADFEVSILRRDYDE